MKMIQHEVLDEKGTKNIQSGVQARSGSVVAHKVLVLVGDIDGPKAQPLQLDLVVAI